MHLSPLLASILERALGAPAAFARALATDADGTLWSGDVGDTLFLHIAERGLLRGPGLARLREHARRLVDPALADADGPTLARALYARYAQGAIEIRVMCDLESEAVGGRPLAELEAIADEVGAQLAPGVRPEVRTLLAAAREAGMAVHVVTGSLGLAVEATLRHAGIAFDSVSGGVLRVVEGVVGAELERHPPLFEGKVTALREGGCWPAALGLGDGGWDHTFLREVHVPVLVHPQPALEHAMRDVSRAITLR